MANLKEVYYRAERGKLGLGIHLSLTEKQRRKGRGFKHSKHGSLDLVQR